MYSNIGNTYAGAGNTLAGLYSGAASDKANILGNQLTNQLGVGRDVTTANINANNMVLQSAMADSANKWGAINAGLSALGAGIGGGIGKKLAA